MKTLDLVTKQGVDLSVLKQYASSLEHLKVLPDIKDKLLDSATGRKQVDFDVVKILLYIGGTIIGGLLFINIYLMTGHRVTISDFTSGHSSPSQPQ